MLNKESTDYLKEKLPFWPHLTREEESLLLRNISPFRYRKGQNIYNAETQCLGIMLVKSGELRTYILSEEGKEATLYRINRGEVCVLSASCILDSITFDVHIDAEQDTEVLVINPAYFAILSRQNVYAENFALRVGMERFSEVMWAMEQILFMSFDRRLAIFLLDETAKTNNDDLPLTQEQIAKYMGSAREVVSRMLKYFAKEGIVEIYRGGIKITDREKLKLLL